MVTTGYAVLRGHHWVCSTQRTPLGMQCSEWTSGYSVLMGMQCSGDTTGYAVLRGDHWVCSAQGYAVLRGHHWVCSSQGGPLGICSQKECTTGYAVLRGDHWVYAVLRGDHCMGIWGDLCMKCSEGMQGLYACRGYVHCHSTMAWESIIDTYFGSLSAIATLIAAKSITAFCLHRQYRTACTSLTHTEGIQQAQMLSLSISYVHQYTQWCLLNTAYPHVSSERTIM